MKRRILLLIILMGLIAGPSAVILQSGASTQSGTTAPAAVSQQYLNKSSRHKLIVRSGAEESSSDATAYAALLSKGAVVREIDYDSFKLVVADEQALGGRDQLLALGVTVRDEMDLISINEHTLDTTDAEVQQSSLAEASKRRGPAKGGLYIVQFIGPVRDEWLEELEGAGTRIVSYISGNAYIVQADETAALQLTQFNTQDSAVQFVGDYAPAYRLSPGLQALSQSKDAGPVDVIVRVVDGPDTESVFHDLASIGKLGKVSESSGIHTVRLRAAISRLAEIANLDSVLFISERDKKSGSGIDDATLRLLRKQLRKMGQPNPSSAMIRAYKAQVDARQSDTKPDDGSTFIFRDQSYILNRTGQTFQLTGSVESNTEPVRVTLAWSDASGLLSKSSLINDLDLEVAIDGTTYRGNNFSGVESAKGGVADSRSDIEGIYLPAGISGNFTITVRASNIAGDGVSGNGDRTDQHFALVVSNATASLTAALTPSINVTPFSVSMSAFFGGASDTRFITIDSNDNWSQGPFFPPFWLTVSPSSGFSGFRSVTLRASPFGLCPGTYFGTVNFRTSTCCASDSVQVTFTVIGSRICPSPTALAFSSPDGSNPAPQSLNITNCVGGSTNWTASDNAPWLSVSPTSGTTPSTLTVSVNTAGLSPGSYTGQIAITPAGGCSRIVPVTLSVSRPTIGNNPASLSFSATRTGPNPPNQSLNIFNFGSGVLNWTASDNAPWLNISPASGTTTAGGTPSTLTVSVNKTGLAVGNYSATITITSPTASNSPKTIPVSLSVTNSATISVSPTSLFFLKNIARPLNPAPKTFTISVTAGSVNWTASGGASWLSFSPTSGTASVNVPSTVTVSVNPAGLDIGTYTANITINAPGAGSQTVQVTLNVVEIIIDPPPNVP